MTSIRIDFLLEGIPVRFAFIGQVKSMGRITAAHAMSRVLMNQNLSTFSVINSFDDEVAGREPTAVVVVTLTGGDTIGQVAVVIDGDFI